MKEIIIIKKFDYNDFKSKILNIINYMGKWTTMFSIQMSLPDDKS